MAAAVRFRSRSQEVATTRRSASIKAESFRKRTNGVRLAKIVRFMEGSENASGSTCRSSGTRFVRGVERGRQQGSDKSSERSGRSADRDPPGARQGHSERSVGKSQLRGGDSRRQESRVRTGRRIRQGRFELPTG